MRERVGAGSRAAVVGIQRRACHLGLDGDPLVILSAPDVPLAPNGVAIGVASDLTMPETGFRVGQMVALSDEDPGVCDADWRVTLGEAPTWEPRPRVRRVVPRDLVGRFRATRATVISEGAGESLLPLLWASGADADGLRPGLARAAGIPVRLLCDAAMRRDTASVARAARGLAGLGPGLTPSGDDLLAGFAAAWTLVGESLGLDGAAREPVTDAIFAGAERGASPLGRAWLDHALRGELAEPMTRFVGALLAAEPRDLGSAVRGALAIGASSGTDWMVGFLLSAAAILVATTRGRPW